MSSAVRPPLASIFGLATSLARQWWPQVAALAVACGVVATTIAGALSVGGAMQTGLEQLALQRLGRIDAAVTYEGFFTESLAERFAAGAGGPRHVVPAIVIPAVAEKPGGGSARITLLACDDPAALGFEPSPPPLEPNGVLVNLPLAESLGLAAGEPLVLRLPTPSSVPADSPLGRRTGASAGRRMSLTGVLPPQGIGQFSLRPVQATPPLAVTSLITAQRILRQADAANVLLAVGMPADADGNTDTWLRERLLPTLSDYGLVLEEASENPPSLRLASRRLILSAAVDAAAAKVLQPRGGRPTLVFLANSIEPVPATVPAAPLPTATKPVAGIPYSTVLGLDTTRLPTGDLVDEQGELLAVPGDEEIIIDRWVADDLAAQGQPVAPGDRLRLSLFAAETVHGKVAETTIDLRISGVAAMQGTAIARGVVPEVEGITDEDSIADWDPPFPFDATRVRTSPPHDEDDLYWKAYGPTPKAFVSLATARRVAGSRFGSTTAWLVPKKTIADQAAVVAELAAAIPPEAMGLRGVPLRSEALAASRGSTPFGGLFLALSSFVVIAGLFLTWLLFGLLVAARGKDLGILSAVGFPPRRLALLLLIIGGMAAAGGGMLGTLLGPLWARGLFVMLGRAWTASVDRGSAVAFQPSAPSVMPLLAGGMAAVLISLAALAWAARRGGRIPPLALLKRTPGNITRPARRRWLVAAVALGGLVIAGLTATVGRNAGQEAAIGLFFTAGFAALAGLLAIVWLWLSAAPTTTPTRTLRQLAGRNLGFAAGRAFSVAAIVAAATFLIVAVSSFAQRPPLDPADHGSPTGGWTEVVTFGAATSIDPADSAVRTGLGLSSRQQAILAACEIALLRTNGGDDAACTNLYATLQPTVVGVGAGFISRGGFRFVANAPLPESDPTASPWRLLDDSALEPRDRAQPIPAILDQATAQWGLKLGGVGDTFSLTDDLGTSIAFEIVGLLEPGILQGVVIVAERDFERIYPERSGYGMAMVDASGVPAAQSAEVAAALDAAWADAGNVVTPAVRRLASLQAVQNTFLAGFQALGTLGLLLGTAGVAAVQLQGMFERLGSLAVLRAVGFTLARVRWMLVVETALMVVLGLAAGTAAALLAVAPALASSQAQLPVAWIVATCGLSLGSATLATAFAVTRTTIPTRPCAQ